MRYLPTLIDRPPIVEKTEALSLDCCFVPPNNVTVISVALSLGSHYAENDMTASVRYENALNFAMLMVLRKC